MSQKIGKSALSQKQILKPPPVKEKEKVKEKIQAAAKVAPTTSYGYKATFNFNLDNVNISVPVRYETIKTTPLIETVMKDPQGKVVQRRYIGPAKKLVYLNTDNKEVPEKDVTTFQKMPDGTEKPIVKFKRTDVFDPSKYVEKDVMDEFLPEGYVVIWGEDKAANSGLRTIAFKLRTTGKVAMVKFTHGGLKAYWGFVYPVVKYDKFALEMMLTSTKKEHARWAAVEPEEEEAKREEAELPELV